MLFIRKPVRKIFLFGPQTNLHTTEGIGNRTMLVTSFELENFKAFGKRVTIPLAPITLIFGENSAGKSSILQSLNMLKQTVEGRDPNAILLTRAENGIVDLGSFQDVLFDHDLARQLKVKFTVDLNRLPTQRRRRPQKEDTPTLKTLEFTFQRPSVEEEVSLASIELFSGSTGIKIARYEIEAGISVEMPPFFWEFGHPRYGRMGLQQARCSWVTDDESIWKSYYDEAQKARPKLLEAIEQYLKRADKREQFVQAKLFDSDDSEGTERQSSLRALISNMSTLLKDDKFSITQFVDVFGRAELGMHIAIESFLPVAREANELFNEFLMRLSRHEPLRINFQPDFAGTTLRSAQCLAFFLNRLFPLGPFRRPPERWYIFSGTSPRDVGYRGDLLPDLLYRNEEVLRGANEWLENLDIGYQLNLRPVGPEVRDLFEVRLNDTRRNPPVEVNLSDVGFGISQLLPFIVQSLAAKDQTISIEQPEVHIHPRLQADLGDLLADCIKPPRNNQFIIETHSEHLVLRLQRLVRTKQLTPKDVSILYVSRGDNGSNVTRLRLDDEGDFIDDWPGGFFPERLRELGD